jgi:hypothetical protein
MLKNNLEVLLRIGITNLRVYFMSRFVPKKNVSCIYNWLFLNSICLVLSIHMIRKASILLLLSFFLFNYIGYFIVFEIEQNDNKKSILAAIKNDSSSFKIEKIIINDSIQDEINWKEENEFEFNGRTYDVIKKINQGSSIIVYCINDEKETELFNRLGEYVRSNLINDNSEKNKSGKELSIKLIKLYFPVSALVTEPFITEISADHYPEISKYTSPLLSFDPPPPDYFRI